MTIDSVERISFFFDKFSSILGSNNLLGMMEIEEYLQIQGSRYKLISQWIRLVLIYRLTIKY